MALGKVQVNNLNLMQGEFNEVENYFLFIGRGSGTNESKFLTVNTDSDLDEILGEGEFNLKIQIESARSNAGQNWNACIYPLADLEEWSDAVDYCMEQAAVEAVVLTDPVIGSTEVDDMQAKAESIMSRYMRPIFFIGNTRKIDLETESWSDFSAAIKPLISGVAADQVSIVPCLWGFDLGTYAGRLCNSSVTVADSPMRVATGPLVGEWSTKPMDKDGREIDMSILEDLDSARFSVPQWYPDYPGMYWGDGNMLDVPAGDYQCVENLRVVQKAMRRVYVLAVARIADRKLNSTPASIAANQTYFMRPLREMSRSVEIMGTQFPGEVKPPKDTDITINWKTKYQVEIYMVVTPYNSPKSITCNLMLDLSNQAEA
ncbi:DUF2586 domain-containing protein [Maridesulfovibrio bastinii]|uniref:DUF2586 domain-containing protein n=1 Tax=Maridesulfovibrio bastinii TaxID=47157 RepID=UPI00040ACF0E|nr:DUF2586 domain-containing protein [Maridesulfovibrio bastinii]